MKVTLVYPDGDWVEVEMTPEEHDAWIARSPSKPGLLRRCFTRLRHPRTH